MHSRARTAHTRIDDRQREEGKARTGGTGERTKKVNYFYVFLI